MFTFIFYFLFAGIIKHIYPPFVDCVLLVAGGNYSSHIISCSFAWKICSFYDDTRYIQVIFYARILLYKFFRCWYIFIKQIKWLYYNIHTVVQRHHIRYRFYLLSFTLRKTFSHKNCFWVFLAQMGILFWHQPKQFIYFDV